MLVVRYVAGYFLRKEAYCIVLTIRTKNYHRISKAKSSARVNKPLHYEHKEQEYFFSQGIMSRAEDDQKALGFSTDLLSI